MKNSQGPGKEIAAVKLVSAPPAPAGSRSGSRPSRPPLRCSAERLFCAWENTPAIFPRLFVVGIVEHRHEHDFIGNIKIGVARRQTRAGGEKRRRTGQGDNIQFPTVLVARALQALVVFSQAAVIIVLRIRLSNTGNGRRIDEARDVVDMAVGIVADDTIAEPEDMAAPQARL